MGNHLHYKRYAFPSLHFVSLGSLSVSFLHSLISSLIPFGHSVDRRFVYSVSSLYLLSIFSFYSFLYRYVYTSLFIYRFVLSFPRSLHLLEAPKLFFLESKKKGTQLRSLLFIDPIHHVILVLIMALISCSGSDCSVF